MSLKPGWLGRQFARVEADVATWPAWMQREAGMDHKEAILKSRIAHEAEKIERELASLQSRVAELEAVLRPLAKAWADRHQINDGQAVEINIDPEWVRAAAEAMVLDGDAKTPRGPSAVAPERRHWHGDLEGY